MQKKIIYYNKADQHFYINREKIDRLTEQYLYYFLKYSIAAKSLIMSKEQFGSALVNQFLTGKQLHQKIVLELLVCSSNETWVVQVLRKLSKESKTNDFVYLALIENIVKPLQPKQRKAFIEHELRNSADYFINSRLSDKYGFLLQQIADIKDNDDRAELYELACTNIKAELKRDAQYFSAFHQDPFSPNNPYFIHVLEKIRNINYLPEKYRLSLLPQIHYLIGDIRDAVFSDPVPAIALKNTLKFCQPGTITKASGEILTMRLSMFMEVLEENPDFYSDLNNLINDCYLLIHST